MPTYEYRCRACGTAFERSRPMADSSASATCPSGHTDTVKLLSTIAITGGAPGGSEPAAGGGCCGGACGCG